MHLPLWPKVSWAGPCELLKGWCYILSKSAHQGDTGLGLNGYLFTVFGEGMGGSGEREMNGYGGRQVGEQVDWWADRCPKGNRSKLLVGMGRKWTAGHAD
jgi:hypothetical protein